MTTDEFHRAAARTQLGPRSREGAYRMLVIGETAADSAAALGVARQVVDRAARRVRRESIPSGWVRVTVALPPERAREVREEAEQLREEWHKC